MKWFENPQTYKSLTDRPKLKTEPDESEDSVYRKYADDLDTRKVIRQYGKAGEVSSGTERVVSLVIRALGLDLHGILRWALFSQVPYLR